MNFNSASDDLCDRSLSKLLSLSCPLCKSRIIVYALSNYSHYSVNELMYTNGQLGQKIVTQSVISIAISHLQCLENSMVNQLTGRTWPNR